MRAEYSYPATDIGDPNYGKILIAGAFSIDSSAGTYYNLARLNANGTVDTGFTKTFNEYRRVNAIGVQESTGKILVGGYSLTVPGDTTHAYHLLLLNGNGSVDGGYTGWSAPGGYVSGVKVFPDDGSSYANMARIFCTTPKPGPETGVYYALQLDVNFTSVLAFIGSETVDAPIFNMAQQSNGQVVICGLFRNVKVGESWTTATASPV